MGRDFSFAFAVAFVFALVLLLLLAAPAQAVMLEISLDELAQKADCVIIGTVLERTSKWNDDHTHIYTTVVVNVEESLKGAVKPGNVSIIVQGGRVGNDFMMVSDTPGFEVGEKAVLFLENLSQPRVSEMRMTQLQADAPVFQVYGYFQGKLNVKDNKVCNVAVSEFKSQLIDSLATGKKMTIGEGGKSKPELVTRDEVATADNYVYNGDHWPINNPTTVTYKIHSSFSPNARTAVQSAATTWSNAGAKFTFSYSGTHNQTPAFENHVNEISRESWGINGTLAQASISGHGDIVDECDMVFNSSYSWCESGTPADWQKDLETVALHEFGHFLVLDHSPNLNSVMFWLIQGTRRSLDPDDDGAGIKAIYGKWLVPPTVATDGHTQLTDTSVRLLGSLCSRGSASSAVVSFMYGPTAACSGGITSTKTLSGGYIYSCIDFDIPLSGLSPNTIYFYKAKAVGDGTGYGSVLSFTTAGGPAVTTYDHSQLTNTSVRLLGDLTSLGSASSAVVSFMYGTTTACSGGTSSTKTFSAPVYFGTPISGLSPGTTYCYKAKAVGNGSGNGIGSANVQQFTTTGGPAGSPTVTTSGHRQLTNTSVRLLGDLTSLGSASSAGVSFECGTTTNCSDVYSSPKTFSAPISFGTPISGLSPGTTYYYRAIADGNGTCYGNILSFTTAGGPAVTTSGNRELTDTSVRLIGNLTNLGSASSVVVSFMYGPTTTCSGGSSSTKTFTAPSSFGTPISGLSPGTTYYYKSKAVGNGTSYGAVLSFTTTGGATPPTVTTSGNRDLTNTSVRFLGNLTNLGSASSTVLSFMYGTTTACTGGTSSTKTVTAPVSFGIPLSGLSPNTTYYYKAKAVGDGTSYGTVLNFTTTGGTPPAVTTSGYRDLTNTSVRLLGDLTNLGSASSVVVSFMYGPTTACTGGTSSTKTFSAPVYFGIPVSGLSPGTTYYYKAKAVGNGTSYGSILSFTTPD